MTSRHESFLEDTMKRANVCVTAGVLLLICSLLTGCGCGKKKERDKTSEEVVRISITPEVTPTPIPEQVNPDAVVTNGGITMVNQYLVEKGTAAPAGNGPAEKQDGGETQETKRSWTVTGSARSKAGLWGT